MTATSLENLPGQQDVGSTVPPEIAQQPQATLLPNAPETPPAATELPNASATPPKATPISVPGLDGVDAGLSAKVKALIAMSGGRIRVSSGYRTLAQQTALYDKLGPSLAAAPGTSNHERGVAVDLEGDVALIAKLAPQVGLVQPMGWEPWHVELPGTHAQSHPAAYTPSPYGDPNPTQDKSLAASPQYQLASFSTAARNLVTAANGQTIGGEIDSPTAGTSTASDGEVTGPTSSTPSGPITPPPLEGGAKGPDKRLPDGHTIQEWAHDVLTGLGKPTDAANLDTLITWADHESSGYNPGAAGGRFNPLNTTEGAVGFVGQGGSQGDIKDFGSYDQGIQAIVHNLTKTKGAGYENILAALDKSDPQAVFQAINNSAFGTKF